MTTLDRILIPLDGSLGSLRAVRCVAPWLRHAERVLLLHVVDPDPAPAMVISDDHGGLYLGPDELDGPAAREYLKRVAADAGVSLDKVDLLVEAGHPASTILYMAERDQATLTVMATHGHGSVTRWALGSQTEKVLRASKTPVLAVPAKCEVPKASEARHILVPIDGSERSLALVPHVCAIATPMKARVTLIHCVPHRDEAADEQAEKFLYRARCAFEDAGLLPHTHVVHGPPAESIVEYARPALDDDVAVDLVAMTTHGRTGLLRWALGSVTERVMRNTELPLLVVRSPE
jgi:nucleotide-binding universal stress UspA family protein